METVETKARFNVEVQGGRVHLVIREKEEFGEGLLASVYLSPDQAVQYGSQILNAALEAKP